MSENMQKVAVVTGATRGFGRAVALELASRGYHIVALGRTTGALEELDDAIIARGSTATLVPIDFGADLNLCDALGASLFEKFGKVDALVMAAAMCGPLTPVAHLDPVALNKAMQVNCMANARLVRSLDGLLKQAPEATVAFITCSLGDDTKAYWAPYRLSKTALVTLADVYAAENQQTKLKIVKHDPGIMGTNLYYQAFPGIERNTLPTAEDAAAKFVVENF